VPEIIPAILMPVGHGIVGGADLLDKAKGTPFDNMHTRYVGSYCDWYLNRQVERVAADQSALRYLKANYDPDGCIGDTRVLTIHAARDPVVPSWHERMYRGIVYEEQNLNQIVVNTFGHGTFHTEHLFQLLMVLRDRRVYYDLPPILPLEPGDPLPSVE
jgi:hypothetical protein